MPRIDFSSCPYMAHYGGGNGFTIIENLKCNFVYMEFFSSDKCSKEKPEKGRVSFPSRLSFSYNTDYVYTSIKEIGK